MTTESIRAELRSAVDAWFERTYHRRFDSCLVGDLQLAADFITGYQAAKAQEVPVIDTCEAGHVFAKLPGHPMRAGRARCPHCLAAGFDKLREKAQDVPDLNEALAAVRGGEQT